jgi:peroxiredoxin Q/BCP
MPTPAPGDPAPDFTLDGTHGPFTLSAHRGGRVVLLFYPGDSTPICTRQFCSYRDRADELGELDATVVGISSGDVDAKERFAAEHGLTVPLLADPDRSVARAYGAAHPLLGTRRAVVVVDADGHIAHHDVHLLGLAYAGVDDLRGVLAQA